MVGQIVPDEGAAWIVSAMESGPIGRIALGTGSTSVASNNTSLDNEIYSAPQDQGNVTVEVRNSTRLRCVITVTAGVEISPDDNVLEVGLFGNSDELIYREVLADPIDITEGQQVTVEFFVEIDPE